MIWVSEKDFGMPHPSGKGFIFIGVGALWETGKTAMLELNAQASLGGDEASTVIAQRQILIDNMEAGLTRFYGIQMKPQDN